MPANPDSIPEAAARQASEARQGTLIGVLDQTSHYVAKLTGTELHNPQLDRLIACMGIMASFTVLASIIPNHDVASFLSNGIGAAGGALAGDTWRPVSRWANNTKRMIRELEEHDGAYVAADFVSLLSRYPDVLSRDELRQATLRPSTLSDKDPRDKALRLLIAQMTQGSNVKGLSRSELRAQRKEIREIWRIAETMAQNVRGSDSAIRKEGALRSLDILVGVSTAFGLALLVDYAQGNALGGFAGLADDFVSLGLIGASAIQRSADINQFQMAINDPAHKRNSKQHDPHAAMRGHQHKGDVRVYLQQRNARGRRM